MKKYHVAVEKYPNTSALSMFGSPFGFSAIYFEVKAEPPISAQLLYEAINKDRDEKHKTGNVIAWSEIIEQQ